MPPTYKALSKTRSKAKASEKVETIPAPYQEVDERLGNQTLIAVRDHQRRHGIAEGQLTMETLQVLQVR